MAKYKESHSLKDNRPEGISSSPRRRGWNPSNRNCPHWLADVHPHHRNTIHWSLVQIFSWNLTSLSIRRRPWSASSIAIVIFLRVGLALPVKATNRATSALMAAMMPPLPWTSLKTTTLCNKQVLPNRTRLHTPRKWMAVRAMRSASKSIVPLLDCKCDRCVCVCVWLPVTDELL